MLSADNRTKCLAEKRRTSSNDAPSSLLRSADMASRLLSHLGAIAMRSVYCAAVLESTAPHSPRKSWSLWPRITTFKVFRVLCLFIIRVYVPLTTAIAV